MLGLDDIFQGDFDAGGILVFFVPQFANLQAKALPCGGTSGDRVFWSNVQLNAASVSFPGVVMQ